MIWLNVDYSLQLAHHQVSADLSLIPILRWPFRMSPQIGYLNLVQGQDRMESQLSSLPLREAFDERRR
jgi:hypothetical protein